VCVTSEKVKVISERVNWLTNICKKSISSTSALNLEQVLQVVNPNITYVPKNRAGSTKVTGIAIILKEFLREADKFNIEHEGEKKIRSKLQGHPRCGTRMKQYFNILGSTKNAIDRNDANSVRCSTCICIPRDEIPEGFFQIVEENVNIDCKSITMSMIT